MLSRLVVPGIESLADFVGTDLGPGEWVTVDQDRIEAFAAATDDHQWIHVDAERARRESPFGQPVAHGYLTLALAPVLLGQLVEVEGCRQIINHGIDKLRLREPVPAGGRLRLSGKILAVRRVPSAGARVSFDLRWELEGSRRPACQAQAVYVYLP